MFLQFVMCLVGLIAPEKGHISVLTVHMDMRCVTIPAKVRTLERDFLVFMVEVIAVSARCG